MTTWVETSHEAPLKPCGKAKWKAKGLTFSGAYMPYEAKRGASAQPLSERRQHSVGESAFPLMVGIMYDLGVRSCARTKGIREGQREIGRWRLFCHRKCMCRCFTS